MDGKRFLLRYAEHDDQWTLQSGFDGDELLTRPGIELITVDGNAIRDAVAQIDGCERCRGDKADIPFDRVLADVLHKDGQYDFILSESAHCPNCRAVITEKTFVEVSGGIEAETLTGPKSPPGLTAHLSPI